MTALAVASGLAVFGYLVEGLACRPTTWGRFAASLGAGCLPATRWSRVGRAGLTLPLGLAALLVLIGTVLLARRDLR